VGGAKPEVGVDLLLWL